MDRESEGCESEDDYTDNLADYLRDELRDIGAPDDGRHIRVVKRSRTKFGNPDVLSLLSKLATDRAICC